jgi:protein-tyrosine phosphatase
MIDLHLHLLPMVDDGAESIAESVEMCRLAAEDGCTVLVATPHRRRAPWPDRPLGQLTELLDRVRAVDGMLPELLLGAEVRVDAELVRELDATGPDELPTLGPSNAMLIELEPRGAGPDPVQLVADLRARGFRPLVAHPELTPSLRRSPGLAERLVVAGARLQVTAMSVTGEFGPAAKEAAGELFDAGLVHVVASDAHRVGWRPPGLARARRAIADRWGEATAEAVTVTNARALLAGRRDETGGGRG